MLFPKFLATTHHTHEAVELHLGVGATPVPLASFLACLVLRRLRCLLLLALLLLFSLLCLCLWRLIFGLHSFLISSDVVSSPSLRTSLVIRAALVALPVAERSFGPPRPHSVDPIDFADKGRRAKVLSERSARYFEGDQIQYALSI